MAVTNDISYLDWKFSRCGMRQEIFCNYLSVAKERKKERRKRVKRKRTRGGNGKRARSNRASERGSDWRMRLYVKAIGKGMCVSRLVIDDRNYTELLSVCASGFTLPRFNYDIPAVTALRHPKSISVGKGTHPRRRSLSRITWINGGSRLSAKFRLRRSWRVAER